MVHLSGSHNGDVVHLLQSKMQGLNPFPKGKVLLSSWFAIFWQKHKWLKYFNILKKVLLKKVLKKGTCKELETNAKK